MSSNLAKSALWVTISEIIFNLSGYVIHSVVGRILGPADYGRYGLVVTLTTMVIILIGNGIPTAMAKYISEIFESKPGLVKVIKKQTILLQSALIGIITLIFFFSAPLIAKILGDPTLTNLFRISTIIIPAFAMASFYFSYYTGLHQFNIQSILKTLRSLLKIAAIITLAYFWRVEGSVVGYAVAAFSVFIIAFLIDQFYIKPKLKKQESRCHSGLACPLGAAREPESTKILNQVQDDKLTFDYKKLLNYAWQVIVFFLAYELLISIDLYLVKGILRNDYLTGIYNASLTVGRIPYYVFYALTVILLPVVSKTTAENDHKKTGTVISQSLRLMIVLLVPSVILMALFSRQIIKIFYSAKYIDAAYPMSILVFGVGFLTIFYVMCFVMNGAGKTKIPMIISTIGVILNTLLNYILIKKFSLVGSAIATSFTSFIVMFIMLYYIERDFKVSIKIESLTKIFLAAILMYFISHFFPQGDFIFILWSIVLFGCYLFILYILKEIKKEDIKYLRKIISRKKVEPLPQEKTY